MKKLDGYEEWESEFEWFDGWCEAHAERQDRGDTEGVVRLCQQRFERDPDDPYALEHLAHAFLENGQPERALELVEPFYRADPDHPVAETTILTVLQAESRSLDSYSWLRPPKVVPLNDELLDAIHWQLKPKRKPRPLYELFLHYGPEGYRFFEESDLLEALKADPRFDVDGTGVGNGVKVRRGR